MNIRNIKISYNGDKDYGAIAEIEAETVYRGPCNAGDTVSVLLPCPIMEDYWVEDTGTVSAMRAGMTGIFMLMIYDDTSVHLQNGARLESISGATTLDEIENYILNMISG